MFENGLIILEKKSKCENVKGEKSFKSLLYSPFCKGEGNSCSLTLVITFTGNAWATSTFLATRTFFDSSIWNLISQGLEVSPIFKKNFGNNL